MSYVLFIGGAAKLKLQRLPRSDRARIAEKIHWLGMNPDDERLDVKPLQGTGLWRIRVGKWRVIYHRDDVVRVISIERIGARGDVYK